MQAAADRDPTALVEAWEARVRRVLLVAHVFPAAFGLIAIVAEPDPVRGLDVVTWSVVLGWTLFLLIFGWTRTGTASRLALWIGADAIVMGALMFIGTPARSVANYVAIDGALFAAVFVSAPVAIAQVTLVYAALGVAALARSSGSALPSPIQGWQTPIIVTLAGILALRFLRSALDRLAAAFAGRVAAIEEERALLAEAAADEAIVRDAAAIERELAPEILALERMARDYAGCTPAGGAREEADWLVACSALARSELASLQEVLEGDETEQVDEVIDRAILGASAARLLERVVTRELEPAVEGLLVRPPIARAVSGFVREAVANALFHGATPVCVTACRTTDGCLRISVRDGGPGYDVTTVEPGLGLAVMQEQADAVGARLLRSAADGDRQHEIALLLESW